MKKGILDISISTLQCRKIWIYICVCICMPHIQILIFEICTQIVYIQMLPQDQVTAPFTIYNDGQNSVSNIFSDKYQVNYCV